MDWDDEFDNTHDGMTPDLHRGNVMPDEDPLGVLDSTNIGDPASAYLLLSDDAQDEITETSKKKMKCLACGHRFLGQFYDRCPKCDSLDIEEGISILDDEEDLSDHPNMRCLDCDHKFVGEIYDRCPECFSSDTEQMTKENGDGSW